MIYIYHYKEPNEFIIRTAPPREGDSPSWTDYGCHPFDIELGRYIKELLYPSFSNFAGWIRIFNKSDFDVIFNFIQTVGIWYNFYESECGKNYNLTSYYYPNKVEEQNV